MADDKDKNAQQAPAVDNTSPEEKALADKLMAELMASGVDVNALAAKTPIAPPAGGSAPAATPPPKPAPPPPPASVAPKPAAEPTPPPSPAPVTPPPPSTSSGPTAPPVPTMPPPAPIPVVTPTTSSEPTTSTQDVESFIQSLDSTLARLNDSQFFVIRISKPVFYILTAVLGLLLIVVPRLPH